MYYISRQGRNIQPLPVEHAGEQTSGLIQFVTTTIAVQISSDEFSRLKSECFQY